MNIDYKKASEIVMNANKIAVLAHRNPDGDSLGGAIGFALGVKQLGKDVTILSETGVPDSLQFLPGVEKVGKRFESSSNIEIVLKGAGDKIKDLKYKTEDDNVIIVISPSEGSFSPAMVETTSNKIDFDLVVTIDCGEIKQLGDNYELFKDALKEVDILNLDHHQSNDYFGTYNLVDIDLSSSCEVVMKLLDCYADQKIVLNEDVSTCLLAGVITDTGSFMNANTSDKSFGNASRLLGFGADHTSIIKNIFKTNPLGLLKMWGDLFQRIVYVNDSRMLYVWVTDEDFVKHNVAYGETGQIIDRFMSSVPDVDVVVLFRELKQKGRLEVSMRSPNSSVNVFKFMEKYEGGGHLVAAGCKITCDNLEMKRSEIVREFIEFLKTDECRLEKSEVILPEITAAQDVANEIIGAGDIEEELPEAEEVSPPIEARAPERRVNNERGARKRDSEEIDNDNEITERAEESKPEERSSKRFIRKRKESSEFSALESNIGLKELPEDHPLRQM
jgi:phosphoesterase RecJ-like protein